MIINAKFTTKKFKLNVYKKFRLPDSENFNLRDFLYEWTSRENKRRKSATVDELNFIGVRKEPDKHFFTDYNEFMRCDRCGLRFEFSNDRYDFFTTGENRIFERTGCL